VLRTVYPHNQNIQEIKAPLSPSLSVSLRSTYIEWREALLPKHYSFLSSLPILHCVSHPFIVVEWGGMVASVLCSRNQAESAAVSAE